MAWSTAQEQPIDWTPPTTHSVDEYSPLLQKPSYQVWEDPCSDDEATVTPTGKRVEGSSLVWIMMSVWIGTFTSGLDGNVMATLAAPIATSFNSLSVLAWLATAYLLGQAATQPLSGKLTDIFSRQWGLIVSNILFALGNIICGFAPDKWTMIFGRVLAGIGGGCLNTISSIIVSDLIPLRQRALWQGMSNVFWGLGSGLGGLFGGYINDTWNWRLAFLAQVPLTLVSLLIVGLYFRTIGSISPKRVESKGSGLSRVDFTGAFLLVMTLVLFLLGLTVGGNTVPWSHPLAYIPVPLSLVFLSGFVYVEGYVAREPILPLHFLRNSTITFACIVNWCFQVVLFLFTFYIPIYYRVRGVNTTKAGTALTPIGITLPLGSLIAGTLTSWTGKYKYILWTTLLLLVLGTIGESMSTVSTPFWLPIAYLVLIGLGMGGMLVVTLVAITSAVEVEDQALVTSLSYVFRATGSVMGVAIGSSVYQAVLGNSLWSRLHDVKGAADYIARVRDSLDEIERLPTDIQTLVRGGYMVALRATFSTTVGIAVLAVVCGVMVKELRLYKTITREDDVVHKPDSRDSVERN